MCWTLEICIKEFVVTNEEVNSEESIARYVRAIDGQSEGISRAREWMVASDHLGIGKRQHDGESVDAPTKGARPPSPIYGTGLFCSGNTESPENGADGGTWGRGRVKLVGKEGT